jgi:hypothetical protein
MRTWSRNPANSEFNPHHRAAGPERASLLEFRYADALALVVGGAVYFRILPRERHRMEEMTRGKNRQADPIGS